MAGDDPAAVGSAVQWVQAGGVALFAAAVWVEVRALRAILAEQAKALAALLEHDRMASRPTERARPPPPRESW